MHGRRFKMYKLRTMVRGAEEMRDESYISTKWPARSLKFATTRASIRWGACCGAPASTSCRTSSTSCCGQMSLVGPRPALPCEVEAYDRSRSAA